MAEFYEYGEPIGCTGRRAHGCYLQLFAQKRAWIRKSYLRELLSRMADHCTHPNVRDLTGSLDQPVVANNSVGRLCLSWTLKNRSIFVGLGLHKWRQQSSGLCKQHVRDSFSRMTVPQGRDGSLLGFACEN